MALTCAAFLAGCGSRAPQPATENTRQLTSVKSAAQPVSLASATDNEDPESYTNVLIHNVVIITAQQTRMKVKWMRARMYPTKRNVPASFDDLTSFRLQISEGLMGMNVTDLATLLKRGSMRESPMHNLQIYAEGGQLRITGTLRKIVPLPVQLIADITASPDHRTIRLHTVKLSVLKIPFKKVLGVFRLHTADFFHDKQMDGVKVVGDDIDIDVNRLMPQPQVNGTLTEVRLWKTGDLMEYYGKPQEDAVQVKQWRNFMRMRGGTLSFGKLTMHNTDLLLVDVSQSDWLNFDVLHYQEQLVNGETHITATAGLQIFIPDINKISASKRNHDISLQWMKNRNVTPPSEVQ